MTEPEKECPACGGKMIYTHIVEGRGTEGYSCHDCEMNLQLYTGVCDKLSVERHAQFHGELFGKPERIICGHCGYSRPKTEEEAKEYEKQRT